MRFLAYALVACPFCFFLSTSLPQTAAAQSATRATEDAEYRNVIEEALQEFNRGNWEEASALFERAHRLNPSARTLRGMGLTAYEARRYVDSIRYLTEALAEQRRPLTQAQRDEVTATLDRARRFVAHLRLNVGPATARVTINGRLAEPDSKGEVATDPGLLDVEISAEGYEPALRRVRLTAGGHEELNVQLSKVREAVTAPTQLAPVVQQPPPAAPPPADEGTSAVTVLKWVVGGVAVAGLAAGGILLAYQKTKAAQYQETCTSANVDTPRCMNLKTDVTGSLWNTPIILFSVGGGLFAVATVLFIVDATDDPEPAPAAAARNGCGIGGPGELGVSCRLTF